jgi:hypothetical protein
MKCKQVHPHLKDYLNQALDYRMHAAISAHLETCADCRRELNFIKNYLQALEDLPYQNAPVALLSRVKAELCDNPRRNKGYLRLVYSASGLVLAVTAVWLTMLNLNTVHPLDQKKDIMVITEKGPLPSAQIVDSRLAESKSKKSESPLKPIAKAERKERPLAAEPESEMSIKLLVAQPAERRLMLGKAKSIAPAEFSADQELSPEKKGEIPEPDESIAANIRWIVKTNRGKILKEDYDAATKRIFKITITVPAENYRQLMDDLKKVSDLQPEDPETPQNTGMLRIRLDIAYRQ